MRNTASNQLYNEASPRKLFEICKFGFIRGLISGSFLGNYIKPDENTSVSSQVIFELARKLWDKN